MVDVGAGDEGNGDEVVRYHLPVVLAVLLDLDDDDLLDPKGQLGQHVGLDEAVELALRPVGPQLRHVEEVGRGAVDILCRRLT